MFSVSLVLSLGVCGLMDVVGLFASFGAPHWLHALAYVTLFDRPAACPYFALGVLSLVYDVLFQKPTGWTFLELFFVAQSVAFQRRLFVYQGLGMAWFGFGVTLLGLLALHQTSNFLNAPAFSPSNALFLMAAYPLYTQWLRTKTA